MRVFKRLFQWEKQVERRPRSYLLRILLVSFVSFMLLGFLFSRVTSISSERNLSRALTELGVQEETRMESRINELETTRIKK
ncbi:TPA: hypothetical protein DIV55_05560 [Patescibacteria group bacterium]|uniref:Uncharacterized protein n=1 Tax=Candidatus Gottesmanbacteria bacterium GW2011_GWA1_43_11 TaxID=1618436 RepID=A0A0G1F8K2_9BACT|nr:MAG: hypothetical protein UV59_C0048G0002 [Candidatus Gottesmanbacteria bacterium GW2011_GWA1_43_11]HCS79175.1 hypothetical protein [Patescibacteria group bacterium]